MSGQLVPAGRIAAQSKIGRVSKNFSARSRTPVQLPPDTFGGCKWRKMSCAMPIPPRAAIACASAWRSHLPIIARPGRFVILGVAGKRLLQRVEHRCQQHGFKVARRLFDFLRRFGSRGQAVVAGSKGSRQVQRSCKAPVAVSIDVRLQLGDDAKSLVDRERAIDVTPSLRSPPDRRRALPPP